MYTSSLGRRGRESGRREERGDGQIKKSEKKNGAESRAENRQK
jgi:hypothetical protein